MNRYLPGKFVACVLCLTNIGLQCYIPSAPFSLHALLYSVFSCSCMRAFTHNYRFSAVPVPSAPFSCTLFYVLYRLVLFLSILLCLSNVLRMVCAWRQRVFCLYYSGICSPCFALARTPICSCNLCNRPFYRYGGHFEFYCFK